MGSCAHRPRGAARWRLPSILPAHCCAVRCGDRYLPCWPLEFTIRALAHASAQPAYRVPGALVSRRCTPPEPVLWTGPTGLRFCGTSIVRALRRRGVTPQSSSPREQAREEASPNFPLCPTHRKPLARPARRHERQPEHPRPWTDKRLAHPVKHCQPSQGGAGWPGGVIRGGKLTLGHELPTAPRAPRPADLMAAGCTSRRPPRTRAACARAWPASSPASQVRHLGRAAPHLLRVSCLCATPSSL